MHSPIEWYTQRIDEEEGDIRYEAHGPKESLVIFEGPNAKHDCDIFMKAVSLPLPAHSERGNDE